MKKLLLFAAICITAPAFSQQNTKMDFYLASKQQNYSERRADANSMIHILVQGNITAIKQLVEKNYGTFRYSYGNIASIIIPLSALSSFNESAAVTRMEGGAHHIVPCNDTMRLRNNIVAVQQGLTPLPKAYNGKGVVMGFIDTGIDFTHPDFSDSGSNWSMNKTRTRVKYYWDQNQGTGTYTPQPYGYGQAWTQAEMDSDLASNTASTIDFGHGTNVAGAGTANGRANGTCIGGAPKSDIVYVALNLNSSDPDIITDAVSYIYNMADSLKEPCVINVSLGSYDGSHDGLDLQAQMIDSIILAKPAGRVLVTSAGNAGGWPWHLHDSLPGTDTTFTWFRYDAGYSCTDIPIFANKTDFDNVKFKIRCDEIVIGAYNERDSTTVYSDISHFMGQGSYNVNNASGQRLGVVNYYGQIYANNNYSLEFQIVPDSSTYFFGFQATGTGRYDIWDISSSQKSTNIIDSLGIDLNPATYPEIKNYKNPDTLETICSSFQCSPDVITVANYNNRNCYLDYDTALICTGSLPGLRVVNSGQGPTRNYGLIKPDISGAGNNMMSAMPTTLMASYISGSPSKVDTAGWHNIDGGTSMASPGVASVAALYLERFPKATYHDVWLALTNCDSLDAFTGAVPNYKYGYGKVDAFKALQCLAYTDVQDVAMPANPYILEAYPNPAKSGATIEYDFSSIKNYNNAQIIFYDMLGKEVKAVTIQNNAGVVNIGQNTLPQGVYFYSLIVDNSRLKTEKLEVL